MLGLVHWLSVPCCATIYTLGLVGGGVIAEMVVEDVVLLD
jgi:hypothetical protein